MLRILSMVVGVLATSALSALATPDPQAPLAQPANPALLQQLRAQWPDIDFATADLNPENLAAPAQRPARTALDQPNFLPLDLAGFVGGLEPVIAIATKNAVRAYPLRVVVAHGVVNDQLGEVPIAVSYCKACNSAILMRRQVDGEALALADSGVSLSGERLLYDQASESWWRERDGLAVAGVHQGERLARLPAVIISMARFRRLYGEHDDAVVLAETDRSRIAAPTKLNLPTPADPDNNLLPGDDPRDDVPIIDARRWSLDILNPQGRLGHETPIILPSQP